VTSSPDTFTVSPPQSPSESIYASLGMEGVLKTINTPIFTPIAFLHDDARRRSQSRSPPQSPLRLNNALALGDGASAPAEEPKGLGLVDELDTPAPGHMASTPTPLSATTTPTPSEPPSPAVSEKSLEQRFVKSTEREEPGVKVDGEDVKNEDAEVESMVLSEDPQ
jgi:serine/threonine-protein phosphatase 4 regulatory subunit 2